MMTNLANSAALPPAVQRRRFSAGAAILLFFAAGLAQTLLAYVLFSRADDHGYFLELANLGIDIIPLSGHALMDLKAQAAGMGYYILTAPARWLGGNELVHLLWLRLLTLWGFLAAFSWFREVLEPGLSKSELSARRSAFMILVLLYPGQIAWTASLLRDGVGTAMFLLGLYCLRRDWRLVPAMILFAVAFSMRPEYLIILILIIGALLGHRMLRGVTARIPALLALLLIVAVLSHPVQVQSALFGQLAFGDGGFAYPLVAHAFDINGYLQVLLQSLIDPVQLASPWTAPAFAIMDAAFFLYLLWRGRLLLRSRNTLVAALTAGLILGLWLFGYFEIFVGGFSRHRLCLEIALIALIAVVGRNKILLDNRHEN